MLVAHDVNPILPYLDRVGLRRPRRRGLRHARMRSSRRET